MSGKILGRARIKMDGVTLKTEPGASIDIGGTIVKPVTGHEYYGYQEETVPSTVDCVILLQRETPIQALRNAREVTIVFETDIGFTYVVTGAGLADTLKISDGDGKVACKFTGPPAVERTSAVTNNN